jgi:hypothetical protein
MRALVKSGKLTLHDSLDTFPGENHPEGVQGLTTPQGEVHLLANKLTPESMPRVALHEMGVHVGMKGMVGDKVWGDLTSQALTTKGGAFEAARRSVPEDTPEHLKGEETLAYLVENAPHLPIVKRTVAAIKNWVRTTFGARLSITEADIHHLAAKALRKESLTSARSVREGTAFSYVGQKALGADTPALARATKMEQEGVDVDSIRKDTGWFLGMDDKWRFEVDDSVAKYKQDFKAIPEKTKFTVGEVLDNPELYKQYPDAADIKFEIKSPFFDWSQSTNGWYDKGKNEIVVTPYAEDPRSTIIHEIQHWIQDKEGFASGGNSNSVKNYDENLLNTLEKYILSDVSTNKIMKDWVQKDISKVRKSLSEINVLHKSLAKLEGINAKIDNIKKIIDGRMKSIETKTRSEYADKYQFTKDAIDKNRIAVTALQDEHFDAPLGAGRDYINSKIRVLGDEANRLHYESMTYLNPSRAIRELNTKYKEPLDKLRELKYSTEKDIRERSSELYALVPSTVKHRVYKLISGEIEARDVEARKDFTPEQRKDSTPYTSQGISKEDAIVRFDGDTAYAQKPRENSRIGMPHEQILQRVPELTESAKKMMDVLYDNGMLVRGTKGNLAKEVSIKDVEDFARSNPEFRKLAEAHDALVEKYKPVEPYQSLPTPATEAEMQGALKDKQAVNINRPVPDGYKVKLRLDIPAYKRFGIWAVTAHEGNTKKNSIFGVDTATPLAYYGHAVADNPKFSIEEANALKIAGTTRDKYPLATVDGEYVNMSAKEAKRLADEAMTDPDWVQVGMDPERHSYFYDRKTMQPIKSGSRVIQIGSILMVKDPVYGKKSEYVYSVANKLKAQVELDKKNVPTAKESWTVSKKPMMSNLTRAIDIFEQQYMSHDAVLVNSLRRYLEKIGAATEYTLTALTRSNQMQTVNVTSVAAEFTMVGGGDFDSMGIWSSIDSKDNLVSLRQLVDDGGAKQGWTQRETHAYFTNYMVSKRILELFEEAESHEAAANAIVDKDEKAVWLEKVKEIRAVLKRDGANKAKSQATADAYGSIEEFVKAEKMWHAVRANLIKTLVKSGLFSQEKADAYAKALAYVPFNRVMENLTDTDSLDSFIEGMGDNNVGGHRVSALTNGMSNKKLKGSERDVMDIMSNMEAWSQISFTSAIRAKKATDLIDVMRKSMPVGTVTRVHGSQSAEDKAKTVVIYSHGKKQSWMFEDVLMASAFRGTPSAALIVPLLTVSGNIMRSGIVLAPTFTIGQLPQDIYSAFFTAGIKNPFKLAYDLATEFGTTAFSKKDTDTHQILKRMGAVGVKDNIADSKSTHIHDISFHTHYDDEAKTVTAKAWRGLKTKLEKFAMAGDNAIRQAVYKRSMEELKGNPNAKAIATQRAFDVINFRRRGASAVLEQWRSNVPFMGATIQAQRAAFQVIAGRGLAHQDKAEVYKRLVSSSLTMMAMALVHNVLYGSLLDDDDDEFKKKSNRDKDSRIFLLGGNSPVSLAIRPDIWSMPFVGGNHLYQALVGREDAAQTRDALLHTLFMASGLGAPMTPPLLKEIAQYGANYDFFTERPIVPERLQRRATAEQYDTSTSELGKIAGKVGMSPIKFDHIVSSLFSGTGKLVLVASNVASFASNVSVKDHSLRELVRMVPGTSSIVPVGDSFEATNLSYKVRREVETANNTYNSLVKDKLPAEAKAYKLEHKALLNPALITATNLTTKTVDDLHAQLRQIHNSKNLNAAQKKVKEDLINKKVQVAHERYSKWYHKLPM